MKIDENSYRGCINTIENESGEGYGMEFQHEYCRNAGYVAGTR